MEKDFLFRPCSLLNCKGNRRSSFSIHFFNDDCRLLDVEWLKSIWRPDSYFKNAKQVTFQTMTIPNHYLWLYRDKKILYVVK
jgi:hypothetical protein